MGLTALLLDWLDRKAPADPVTAAPSPTPPLYFSTKSNRHKQPRTWELSAGNVISCWAQATFLRYLTLVCLFVCFVLITLPHPLSTLGTKVVFRVHEYSFFPAGPFSCIASESRPARRWYHMLCAFPGLTFSARDGTAWVHPCGCRWHSLLLYGWVPFRRINGPHLL